MRNVTRMLIAVAATLAACSSDAGGGDVPYAAPNPTGKAHGSPCTTNEECLFNTCYKAKTVTGGVWGICTKDCTSGGPESECDRDNTSTGQFTCLRVSSSSGESLMNYCVAVCTSVEQCTAIDARYTGCNYPFGATKFCLVEAP